MANAPLHHLLDDSNGPEQSSKALEEVVRRHRRRRASRMRIAAASAVVLLGGTALGVGLSQGAPRGTAALGRTKPPASRPSNGPETPGPSSGPGVSAEPLDGGLTYRAATTNGVIVNGTAVSLEPKAEGLDLRSDLCASYGCGSRGTFTSILSLGKHSSGELSAQTYELRFAKPTLSLPAAPASFGAAAVPVLTSSLPWCYRTSEVVVEVSSQKVLDGYVAAPDSAAMSSHAPSGIESASEGVLSTKTGEIVVAVAKVSPAVAKATAEFSNGVVTSAIAESDWVVMIARARSGAAAAEDGVSIKVLDKSGEELATTHIAHPGLVGVSAAACPARSS